MGALDRRRPLPLRLQRAAPRRARRHRHRLRRAGAGDFTELGIRPKRLPSDNAFVYRHNRSLSELLDAHGIEHRFIRPRRPQTNGKVERYEQTLKREWGLGRVYRSSEYPAKALSHWLDYYDTRRPHSSLDGRPPISRVHNLSRQDI